MYHYANSGSRDQCVPGDIERPAGVDGTAGIPGGLPESPSSEQPPLTNRGALITSELSYPLANQFLIDWVAFTVKIVDPLEVVKILKVNSGLFSELDYGFSGYRKSLRFGQVSVYYEGRENMGCHVVMSGQGCRQYEGQFENNPWIDLFDRALIENANFTRLDLAHDNVDGSLDLNKLKAAIVNRETRTRFKNATETKSFNLTENPDQSNNGHTIYVGKRSSRVALVLVLSVSAIYKYKGLLPSLRMGYYYLKA